MDISGKKDKETECRTAERRNRDQHAALAAGVASLESEIECLKRDKQELQDRLLRLGREHAEKDQALRNSVTFRAGGALVAAATSFRGAVALPFTLVRIYRDYRSKASRRSRAIASPPVTHGPVRLQSSGGTRIGEGGGRSIQSVRRTEARILFMPTNGGGLGHVTELLAVARRLKADARVSEMVFFTTSQALNVLGKEGFIAYYHPTWDQLREKLPAREWRRSFENLFDTIIHNHKIDGFVFDGVNPGYVVPVIGRQRSLCKVWMRKLLVKQGKEQILDEHAHAFDLQLCLGELGQESIAYESAVRIVVPPLVFLGRDELLPREAVIRQLGLDPAKKTLLVQLGAGNINDIETEIMMIIDAARKFDELQVVIAESPISHGRLEPREGVKTISDYPLSRYYAGTDLAISAAGPNTLAELCYFGIPSIIIPNLATGTDDQLGRAMIAHEAGVGLMLSPLSATGLEECLGKLLDATSYAEFRERCQRLLPVNGADVAAQTLADFLFSPSR